MRTGWSVPWGLGACVLLSPALRAQDACSKLSVAGLRPGMNPEEVHHAMGLEGAATQIVLPGGVRATAEDYTLPEGVVHVEYDGLSSRKGVRVALVRQPLRQTFDNVSAIVKRLGPPGAGRDALVQGLQTGSAIWIDTRCDAVLTYYRRTESWFTEDVNTFLRLESFSRLPAESPATAAVREYVAPIEAPLAAEEAHSDVALASMTAPETAYDSPPRRTEFFRPAYPAGAKQLGVSGVVTLHLVVQRNGTVAEAKVSKADPEGYGFEAAALEAAKRWKFLPASRNGRPVDGEVEIVVRFQ